MTTLPYVIVGGGLAGATAASTLRARKFTGPLILICDEVHHPYSKPELSKRILRNEMPDAKTLLRPIDWYDKQGIELRVGQSASKIDIVGRTVELSRGERITYERLLLATGGTARTLPSSTGLPGVYTLRTLDDAHAVREHLGPGRSVVIVGGGFVGAEVAASARALDTEVTLIEAETAPLSRLLPRQLSDIFAALHRDRGVGLHTQIAVQHIEPVGDRLRVHDSRGTTHHADAVVVAIGIKPNVALAQKAGLDVDNGIVVDEYCRTSAPNVFAAGDVTNHPNALLGRRVRIEHWQNAQHQGSAAARNMLGEDAPFTEIPWVWSDQYEINLQIAGIPHSDDTVVIRGDVDALSFSAFLFRNDVLAAIIGVNKPDDIHRGRRLLAAPSPPPRDVLNEVDYDLAAVANAPCAPVQAN